MISVVVPVYNAETFLEECVRSVFDQTYREWELILVDDGSTDCSGAMIDAFARDDSRVRVVHQANGGMSMARNAGIAMARGEYVYMLDADDVLHYEALSMLLKGFEPDDVDLVIGGAEIKEKYVPGRVKKCRYEILSAGDAIEDSLYQKRILHAPWGKLYRRELLEKVRFTKGLCYEDLDFFYRYCLQCRRIAYTNVKLYFYRQHNASVMHTWSQQRLDVLKVVDEIEVFMAANCPRLLPAARDRKLSANFNIFLLADRHNERAVADRCWRIVKSYRMGSLFNGKVRGKNKIGILLSYFGRPMFAVVGLLFMK